MARACLRCFLLLLTVALSSQAQADPASEKAAREKLARATAEALKNYRSVKTVTPIESVRLRQLLPKADLFCVEVLNPGAKAGRGTFLHTLVMTPEGSTFVETDAQACDVFSRLGLKPADPLDALCLALAFGQLRNYVLCTDPAAAGNPKADPANWNILVRQDKEGWLISCTFITDPTISLCQRYQIAVSAKGVLSVKDSKTISTVTFYE